MNFWELLDTNSMARSLGHPRGPLLCPQPKFYCFNPQLRVYFFLAPSFPRPRLPQKLLILET